MNELFYKKVRAKVKDTLLLMVADHGQVEVNPKTTIYLNQQVTGIEQYLQTNAQGKFLVPAGSARDMFLHIHDEDIDEVVAYLQQFLAGRAEVYKTTDLLAQHFFGSGEPSPVFLQRVGNV